MPKYAEALPIKLQQKNMLFDFYGELLTQKQRDCFAMHYMEDLSLSEIGALYGVTPQAVADILKRANALLTDYEKKLGLVSKHASQFTTAMLINKALEELSNADNREQMEAIRQWVDSLLK